MTQNVYMKFVIIKKIVEPDKGFTSPSPCLLPVDPIFYLLIFTDDNIECTHF